MDSTTSPKVTTMKGKGKGVGAHFFVCSISKIKGHAQALGWGLRRLRSKSIIDIDLHKPNNKLVSV
jgi:hypothetical protein